MVGHPERSEMVGEIYSAIWACKCGVSRKGQIARQALGAILPRIQRWHRDSQHLNAVAWRMAVALDRVQPGQTEVTESVDRLLDELLFRVRNGAKSGRNRRESAEPTGESGSS